MNENNDNRPKRRRRPSSAAQKLLIFIMLAALTVLAAIIYHAAKHPRAAEIIDELNRGVTTTAAPVTETVTDTATAVTVTTTAAEQTSASTSTSEEVTTGTTTAKSGYSTSFYAEFPQSFGGSYTLSVVYRNTEETAVEKEFVIPDTTYMDIELSFGEASTYVPADVYLTNNANGKQALAGTINLDFANDLCDQSGLDIYTALLEVQ
jgi:hypothetical protein